MELGFNVILSTQTAAYLVKDNPWSLLQFL